VVRLSKVIGVTLIVAGFSSLASNVYVELRYYSVMPRAPDPSTGRTYPFSANRFDVYVTQQEAHFGKLVRTVFPFGIVSALIGIHMVRRSSGRRP